MDYAALYLPTPEVTDVQIISGVAIYVALQAFK